MTSIDQIKAAVILDFGLCAIDMTSNRRSHAVARPRQVAMYLARHMTKRSLPEIGRSFGNRDHTTVMHAIGRIDSLMTSDAAFAERVNALQHRIEFAEPMEHY